LEGLEERALLEECEIGRPRERRIQTWEWYNFIRLIRESDYNLMICVYMCSLRYCSVTLKIAVTVKRTSGEKRDL